jgi:hypothetical protein
METESQVSRRLRKAPPPLTVYRTLVLSTGHVTKETADRLNGPDDNDKPNGYMGDWLCYGWIIWSDAERQEIPDDLWRCMKFAQSIDCEYIRFDCDGDTVEFLPTWEW